MAAKQNSATKVSNSEKQNEKPAVPKIRIVIADDHAVLRESLSALLVTQPDFAVEGTAADGLQATCSCPAVTDSKCCAPWTRPEAA
jgi:hypothetical protein